MLIAAAIAVWLDVRFPRLGPADLRTAAIRLAIAFTAAHLAVPGTAYVAQSMPARAEIAAVLVVAFAALTFLMISVLWVVRAVQRLAGGMLR